MLQMRTISSLSSAQRQLQLRHQAQLPLCLYSNLLVYLGPVQAASAAAAAAVNWPMAFCLQNISETLPGLFPVGISISVVCVLLSFGRLFIIVVPL